MVIAARKDRRHSAVVAVIAGTDVLAVGEPTYREKTAELGAAEKMNTAAFPAASKGPGYKVSTL